MAHGTRINGTSYGITGGMCLVNGTEYGIKKGRTLVGGTGYDIGFGTTISSYAEGDIVKFNENGSPADFYVAKHNYESDLNGGGKTLVCKKPTYENKVWDSSNINSYENSDIDKWLNNDYKELLDANVQKLIGTTKFRYTPGNFNNEVSTLERSVFILSLTELNMSLNLTNVEGSALPISDIIVNSLTGATWTRTPFLSGNNSSCFVNIGIGGTSASIANCSQSYRCIPVFAVPSSTVVGEDGVIR